MSMGLSMIWLYRVAVLTLIVGAIALRYGESVVALIGFLLLCFAVGASYVAGALREGGR